MKLLVVDDDADIRTAVRLGFQIADEGYEVREAAGPAEALAALERSVPDVILLDVVLGDFDGVELFEQLRRRSELAEVPVLFLTATTDEQRLLELKSLSGRPVLAKPFDPLALPRRIEDALALSDRDASRGGAGGAPAP